MREPIIITDLAKQVSYTPALYKQYDSSQLLNVKVLSNGVDYPLDGYEAYAYFKIPNKPQPIEERNCTISGSIITVELDSYLLSESGVVPFEVELRKGEEITTTFRLHYSVEESYDIDEAVVTQPNWDIISDILNTDFITQEQATQDYVSRTEYESAMVNIADGIPVDLTPYVKKLDLHKVATSGKYSDLEGAPTKLSQFINDLNLSGGDGGNTGGGGTTVVNGSGYGVLVNASNSDEMITAITANDILKLEGVGLTDISLITKTSQAGSRDTIRITSRFPTWEEIMGNPLTIFNDKDFIYENKILGINPAKVGGGGGGGGLPFINVKSFSVWERNPTTGVLEEVQYGAKGDNTSPDLDTRAIKRAFQIAKEQGSVNIYIPDGNYILNETINVYRNTNVQASRNATIKKTHGGVMFANTLPDEAYVGYDGGKLGNSSIRNNGNIFFDGGIWDNNKTSGSTFSFINAQNFEFKNLTVKDVLDSHAFDLCGIADMIIYNCNFLGFNYRGSASYPDATITPADWDSKIKAYSECIQLDYSSAEGYPYQVSGHDGTACKRVRVDKCVFGKSENFPSWNRVFGGHNTYIVTYDWLHNTDGSPTGNSYNFLNCKPKDVYFLNNVVEGNGTLKYDYDQNDSESFIIQQVRLQCVDNAIIMNNKFRDVKGGISIDVDQTPKTMIADPYKKNFVLGAGTNVTSSGVTPAKITYLDSHGDMQEILYSTDVSDINLNKITTHTHNGITYTIYWYNKVELPEFYGWQNALIMNNELTNVTCGIFSYKQVTATNSASTANNQLVVGDIFDVLGNQVIDKGTEIWFDAETNPRTVTNWVGVQSTDINGKPIQIAPYTLTVYPSFTTLPASGKAIYIKESASKNASTPIYARGQSKPYSRIDATTSNGVTTWKYTSTGTTQPPRGKRCIIYGNIIDGVDQISVYKQYSDVIQNGRKVTYIKAISSDRTVITLNAITDEYISVGEKIYFGLSTSTPDLTTPYQIMALDTATKKVTITPALTPSAVANSSNYFWSRKPILAGETGGASIISAISTSYIHDSLIQENIFKNLPRAIYHSGDQRMNIIGNHFYQMTEVEAICINGGDYCNIIGNIFYELNDQAIEIRNNNYFNIANNEFLNTNKGEIFKSAYPEVDWSYDPLSNLTIVVLGDGAVDGQYGTITGNMFVHNNAKPINTGIKAGAETKFIKMSNNSFPSPFTIQQDNLSDVGLDYGYRGNDADTLQGVSLDGLGDVYIGVNRIGANSGVAELDGTGKVPLDQLPSVVTAGSAAFKFIKIPAANHINKIDETLTATTDFNAVTLIGTGGIWFDAHEGNTLEIHYDSTLVDEIPTINLAIENLDDNQQIMEGNITALQDWKTKTADPHIADVSIHHFSEGEKTQWADKFDAIQGNSSKNIVGDIPTINKRLDDIETTVIPDTETRLTDIDGTGGYIETTNIRLNDIDGTGGTLELHENRLDKIDGDGGELSTIKTDYFKKDTADLQNVLPPVSFNKDVTLTKYEEKYIIANDGTCDLSKGSIFKITPTTTITINLSNYTATTGDSTYGFSQSIVLYIVMVATLQTINFPASIKWHNATPITMTTNKIYEIVLRTIDNGVSWLASNGGVF